MEHLKLESGQVMRILALTEDDIYETISKYWDNHLKRHFIHTEPLNVFRDKTISKVERHTLLVLYNGELKIIEIGRKIKEKLNDYVSTEYNMMGLYQHSLNLHIQIGSVSGFPSFDDCFFTTTENDEIHYYFETDEYKELISWYNKRNNRLQLSNNNFMIEYLNIIGILDNKSPLLRLLKMDRLKKK